MGVDLLYLGEDLSDLVVGSGSIDDRFPDGEQCTEGGDGLPESVACLRDECAPCAQRPLDVVHEVDLLRVGFVGEEASPTLTGLGHRLVGRGHPI